MSLGGRWNRPVGWSLLTESPVLLGESIQALFEVFSCFVRDRVADSCASGELEESMAVS